MDINLFVIVVTFNGMQWYERCFDSLRCSSLTVQTIVVDNASNDGTVGYIRNHYPEIILIENKENLGFGRANNKGMRYALDHNCDYVFLLNQDAWVEPDTFEKMVCIHQRHKEYGILGCINVTKEKDHMLKGFIPTIADPSCGSMDLIDDMYFSRLYEVYEIKSILASAWLLPRVILETVGGFDPIFFHYGEDDNYLQRVLYHGFKVGVCPLCPIVHDAESARVREAVLFRGKEFSQKRDWLLDWCNVLSYSKKTRAIDLLVKAFSNLIRLKYKKAFYYWNQYLFYKKNKNAVSLSLAINKKVGRHYL